MNNKIHILEENILRSVAKRICIQSPHHKDNVTRYMLIMREALTEEFTEDNKPTLDTFIWDCLEDALS